MDIKELEKIFDEDKLEIIKKKYILNIITIIKF